MKNRVRIVSGLAILLLLASGIPAIAQGSSALTVAVTGSSGFRGTATINQFVNQGGQIVAVGSVANSTRTAFVGVSWPVTLSGNTSAVAYHGSAPAVAHFTRVAWSPNRQNCARVVRVQTGTGTSCGVLTISLGATNINIAGASVALDPIGITVSGQTGTPVGGIVCNLLSLVSAVGGIVGSVANVVNLLNSLLGSLTGALGGVTGGVGGVTGGVGGVTGLL
jgi:hypothetical protein